jgi:uncharacterized protein YjbI with pentapeptide repeats
LKTNRILWLIAAILSALVLGGIGMLFVRLRPYWTAKYRGARADLRCADLRGAKLLDADLRGADLRGANFQETDLDHITGLVSITIEDGPAGRPGRVVSTYGLDPKLTGARYNDRTRWPADFDPRRHDACLVK